MDETPRNALEEDAYCLIEAAALLDQARGQDDGGEALATALNNNLNLGAKVAKG